jgi:hypothetical protein
MREVGFVLLGECVFVYGSGYLSVYSPHDTNDHHDHIHVPSIPTCITQTQTQTP